MRSTALSDLALLDLEPVRCAVLRSDAAAQLDRLVMLAPADRCKLVVQVMTECAQDAQVRERLRNSTLAGALRAEYARRSQDSSAGVNAGSSGLLAPPLRPHAISCEER
jgi:hypothetical protein